MIVRAWIMASKNQICSKLRFTRGVYSEGVGNVYSEGVGNVYSEGGGMLSSVTRIFRINEKKASKL